MDPIRPWLGSEPAPLLGRRAESKRKVAFAAMMKRYFEEMFAFEGWANESLLAWMEAHEEIPEATRVFAHTVAENHPWLHLMRGEAVPQGVHPEPDWSLAECRAQLGPTMDALASFVVSREEADFGGIVRSETPTGIVFENTLTELLTHLLNHAEHHRGQILWLIAKETGEYVPSLYMPYLRRKGRPIAA